MAGNLGSQLSEGLKRHHSYQCSGSSFSESDSDTPAPKRHKPDAGAPVRLASPFLSNSLSCDPPPRRRVNPESLARRLGDDMVRDMEALIFPGCFEMPSFAVRKVIQEKYNTDRRHIYDYFHSRGLRVVKEDKHGNLKRNKETVKAPVFPIQSSFRSLRRMPAQNLSESEIEKRIYSWTLDVEPVKKKASAKRRWTSAHASPSSSATNGDVSVNVQLNRIADPLDSLCLGHGVEEEETTPNSDPSFSAFDENENDSEFGISATGCFSEELQDFSPELSTSASESSGISPPLTLMDHVVLSPTKRKELYDILDARLGPSVGYQEVGTYKAHMAERSRVYYERISGYTQNGIDARPFLSSDGNSEALSNCNLACEDDVEFQNWITLDGDFSAPTLDRGSGPGANNRNETGDVNLASGGSSGIFTAHEPFFGEGASESNESTSSPTPFGLGLNLALGSGDPFAGLDTTPGRGASTQVNRYSNSPMIQDLASAFSSSLSTGYQRGVAVSGSTSTGFDITVAQEGFNGTRRSLLAPPGRPLANFNFGCFDRGQIVTGDSAKSRSLAPPSIDGGSFREFALQGFDRVLTVPKLPPTALCSSGSFPSTRPSQNGTRIRSGTHRKGSASGEIGTGL